MSKMKYKFRDVSDGMRKIRDFLLGRVYVKNSRYLPLLAPRSVPTPDIPRGPEYKYSNQYYHKRNPIESVHPPVVAPLALGSEKKLGGMKAIAGTKSAPLYFATVPTPGCPYWWDAHCYYECVHDFRPNTPTPKEDPPPTPPPCPSPKKAKTPSDPCDPCQPS